MHSSLARCAPQVPIPPQRGIKGGEETARVEVGRLKRERKTRSGWSRFGLTAVDGNRFYKECFLRLCRRLFFSLSNPDEQPVEQHYLPAPLQYFILPSTQPRHHPLPLLHEDTPQPRLDRIIVRYVLTLHYASYPLLLPSN